MRSLLERSIRYVLLVTRTESRRTRRRRKGLPLPGGLVWKDLIVWSVTRRGDLNFSWYKREGKCSCFYWELVMDVSFLPLDCASNFLFGHSTILVVFIYSAGTRLVCFLKFWSQVPVQLHKGRVLFMWWVLCDAGKLASKTGTKRSTCRLAATVPTAESTIRTKATGRWTSLRTRSLPVWDRSVSEHHKFARNFYVCWKPNYR